MSPSGAAPGTFRSPKLIRRAALIADIGGTNARFAVVAIGGREPHGIVIYKSAEYASFDDALDRYIARLDPSVTLVAGCMGVAAPIIGDEVQFTNSPWGFSIKALKAKLHVADLIVVNDFVAVAHSIAWLTDADIVAIGGGKAVPDAPIGIIGPGTGLGVSSLVAGSDGHYVALAAEGGHVSMAACDDREAEVLAVLRHRFGHVSAERVISGQGLINIYLALCELSKIAPTLVWPEQITEAALAGTDAQAVQTLDLMFAMLGTVASNLALTVGAVGGVMLAGGILPKLAPQLAASRFRARFEDKGRYGQWLGRVPTKLIIHPETAFLGLCALVGRMSA